MTNVYSVSTLMDIYSQSLSSSLDAQLLVIEGFYFDQAGKLYGSVYYDRLFDRNKKNQITITIPGDIKSKLVSKRFYQFRGYINRAQSVDNDSRLKVFFRVTEILKLEKDVQLIDKVEYDIVRERWDRINPNIQDLIIGLFEKKEKPRIDIILGENSTSLDDYSSALKDKHYYNIYHHECNLSSQTAMLNFMNSNDFSETDLLVFIRGGGTGLEVFDELELCKKAIELPVPFITGIGHDQDVTLLQKVSDKSFSTPTAVGVFLQEMIEIHKRRESVIKLKEEEITQLKVQHRKEQEELGIKINDQKKSLRKVYIALFILAATILLILYFMLK